MRITRPSGRICWQVGNHVNGHGQIIPLGILLHPLFAEHVESDGLRLRNRLIWHFEHGLDFRQRLEARHETNFSKTNGHDCMLRPKTAAVCVNLTAEPARKWGGQADGQEQFFRGTDGE